MANIERERANKKDNVRESFTAQRGERVQAEHLRQGQFGYAWVWLSCVHDEV